MFRVIGARRASVFEIHHWLVFFSAVVPGVRHEKSKYMSKQCTSGAAGGLESKDVWDFSAPERKTAAAAAE